MLGPGRKLELARHGVKALSGPTPAQESERSTVVIAVWEGKMADWAVRPSFDVPPCTLDFVLRRPIFQERQRQVVPRVIPEAQAGMPGEGLRSAGDSKRWLLQKAGASGSSPRC